MNKKVLIGLLLAVMLLALVVPPYVLLLTRSTQIPDGTLASLQESFYKQHGAGAQIETILVPEIWAVLWEDEATVSVSLWLKELNLWGKWLSTPKEQE